MEQRPRPRRCPACQSARVHVAVAAPVDREYFSRRAAPVHILRCEDCASLFQDPWPAAAEMASLYPEHYQDYTTSRVPLIGRPFMAQQRRAARAFVTRFGRDIAVLDYGCGPGFFLSLLHDMGVETLVGVDFDDRNDRTGAPYRFCRGLDEVAEAGLRFDVIRMNHVIEHLVDVDEVMRRLASLLTEGGRIVGQTPKASHLTAGLFGAYWGALHYPYHTVLFSPDGLGRAAARWGLTVTETAQAFMPTGWAMSLENIAKALLRSSRPGRSVLYPILLGLSAPFVVVDAVRGDSAVFDFTLVPGPTN